MSAATYATGGQGGAAIGPGSVAALFGANLASGSFFPDPLLLPTELGGARVLVGGIPAPLMFVSPTQIDFQMPVSVTGPTTVVVSTRAGNSRPQPVTAADSFGVFTVGAGGCGAADAMNQTSDGSLWINVPYNSVSPGEILAVYGTGLSPVYPPPPDGFPAPSDPLPVYTGDKGATAFDIDGPVSPNEYAGWSAGLVGTSQINVRVPEDVREGCAVPLLISTGENGNSKPVTVSIRKGGGPCSDPPPASYGSVMWVKTVVSGSDPGLETDTVSVSLQASPGKRKSPAVPFEPGSVSTFTQNFGGQCPVPGYRSLDAGPVFVEGPGFGPVESVVTALGPPDSGQIAGLTEYLAILPPGTIQPGLFSVTARGGVDIGAFRADLRIGSGISITTPLAAGLTLDRQEPLALKWTGGDAGARVTLKVVAHHGSHDHQCQIQARVSNGAITLPAEGLSKVPAGPVEVVVQVDPEETAAVDAPALSWGAEQSWRYVYRFMGLALD